MSIEILSTVLHHAPCTGSAKLVLIGLANHAGQNGSAFPSIDTLARYGNIDRRTVQRILRQLEAQGLLLTKQRTGTSTLYKVNLECPPACDRSTQHRIGGDTHAAPDTDAAPDTHAAGGGDTDAAGGATPTPPKPSFNRHTNQNNPAPEFATFWENYPRKIAKQAAVKAFNKLTAEQQAQAAVTAAAYALSDLPEDEKFIPHAATWLTRGSWADTFTPSKKRAAHLSEEAAKLRREQAHTEWLAQLEAEKQAAAPAPRCLQNAALSFLQCKHPDCITAVANTEKEN